MSDLDRALQDLCGRLGGVRAAVVMESSGIEVAAWGEADFETIAAELAELWSAAARAESVGPGLRSMVLEADGEVWTLTALGEGYVVALLTAQGVPPGKVRFHAGEWARALREEFV